MKNYTSGRNNGGARYGREGSSSRYDSRGHKTNRDRNVATQLHSTICDKCKVKTEVTFLPNGKKPVYCRDCFAMQNDQSKNNRSNSHAGSNFDTRQKDLSASALDAKLGRQLDGIYTKLDQILNVLLNNPTSASQSAKMMSNDHSSDNINFSAEKTGYPKIKKKPDTKPKKDTLARATTKKASLKRIAKKKMAKKQDK